jgi:hypothetical protein
MDITGICVGSAIVAGGIFIILAMVRKHRLSIAREREILTYQVVEGVLKSHHGIHREILIREARKRLSSANPRLSDWKYEINTAISQMKEQGRAEERMDRIYGCFPLDGDL